MSDIAKDGDDWSADDLRILKELYGKMPVSSLATQLQRTSQAIETKASRLNLRRKKPWSEAEDKLVLDPANKPAALAKLLGRGIDAVRHRKRKLKSSGG